jgi:hypothetical protein
MEGGMVMKMWIARDKSGLLALYKCEPKRDGDFFSEYDTGGHYGIFINRNNFPEVTFENSPMEVELVIKK